jgi:formylglycine-generating enzyme
MLPRRAPIVLLALTGASCSLLTGSSEGRSGPCPGAMAYISTMDARSYCIDKWEGSLVEIRGREEVAHSPYEPVGTKKVRAVSRSGVVPQGYISKSEAEAACKASKKRLCTADEWQLACRGKKPTTFPYGDERKEGYCNDSGRAPIASLHPELSQDDLYSSNEALNDPRINQAPNTVAPSGRYSKCKNAFGVFDMVGNLHEWTAETAGSRGTFRGGYYQDTRLNGNGCNYKTVAHDVAYHDYSTGFRCCADAR